MDKTDVKNIFSMNLNSRPFEAIKARTKTIEVRANKNQLMHNGDTIIFTKINTNETIVCLITRITLYHTIRELLTNEDINKTLSSGKNLEDGIKSIESISDYKEQIAKNGVFAIVLELIE